MKEKQEITLTASMKKWLSMKNGETPADTDISVNEMTNAEYLTLVAMSKAKKKGSTIDILNIQKIAGEQPDVKIEGTITVDSLIKGAVVDVKDNEE